MTAEEVLGQLASAGARLWIDHEELKLRAPRNTLSDDLRRAVAENREELFDLLLERPGFVMYDPRHPPLSYEQEALWFIDRMSPGRPAYNTTGIVNLTGPLDVARLRGSLNRLFSRHDVLRATFRDVRGIPQQVIRPSSDFPLISADFSLLGHAAADHAVNDAAAFCSMPFRLGAGPLVRGQLAKLETERHLLALAAHHIVSDGWSIGLMLRELGHGYLSGQEEKAPEDSALPLQYGAFAAFQRARLSGPRLEGHLGFWRQALNGASFTLDLPTDRDRPGEARFQGARRAIRLDPGLVARVRRTGADEGATLYMTLLAAFFVLLARYTHQHRFLVGTPVTQRNRKEFENVIGMFANTLAIPADLSGDPSFREVVARVREVVLDSYSHAEVPFELLVRELRPSRDERRNPLFQVMFSFQPDTAENFDAGPVNFCPVPVDPGTAMFDLTVCLRFEGDGVGGHVEYATDRFTDSTIARLDDAYHEILRAVTEKPDLSIWRLPIVSAAELTRIMSWTETDLPGTGNDTVHGLIERQARNTPDHLAVIGCGERLNYAELDLTADRLALRLRESGVCRGSIVGICLARSPWMIVSMVAVMKAGAAYVGIEPGDGDARRERFLKKLRLVLVITDSANRKPVPLGLRALIVDEEPAVAAEAAPGRMGNAVGPSDLAYVIATSGSTGAPKAVGIEHRNAVSFLTWAQRTFASEELERTLAATSVAFDCALFEILAPLAAGGTVLLSESVLSIPREAEPTMISTVPTAASELIRGPGIPGSARSLVLFGEPLPVTLAAEIYRTTRVDRLYNFYGPSETTTFATGGVVSRSAVADHPDRMSVSIGRPIGNVRAYVLGEHDVPLPIGVPGELCIGGAGVSRGYLGQPRLTTERFVPDPFSTRPGGRMYRTGDIARWLDDGTLEFLGRLDRQVKVRGYRIEPAEVEAVLRKYPGVTDAAAVALGEGPARRLVAYIATSSPTSQDRQLRAYLTKQLPIHMVPSAFVLIDQIPRTASGKLDSRALPPPGRPVHGDEAWRVADEIQVRLEVLWSMILGMDSADIPIDRSFFDLGGHSLLAVVMLTRVREIFGIDIPIGTFFAFPTIESLADEIRSSRTSAGAASLSLVKISGEDIGLPFICVHPGGAEVHLMSFLEPAFNGRSLYALIPVGTNGQAEPLNSIPEMAAYYMDEILQLQARGPYLLGGFSVGGLVALELCRLLRESGADVPALFLLETRLPGRAGRGGDRKPVLTAEDILRHDGLIHMKEVLPSVRTLQNDLRDYPAYDLDGVCGLLEAMKPRLAEMLGELRERGLVVNSMEIDEFHRHREIWARYLWAAKTYEPVSVTGTVILYQGSDTAGSGLDDGWRRLAGRLEIETIPVRHGMLFASPALHESLARRLAEFDLSPSGKL